MNARRGRAFFLLWAGVWLVLVALLIFFWRSLPIYVSWPLAIIEAFFAPDLKYIKDNYLRK